MTIEGEIYRELQRRAREAGRSTAEFMTLYVLEGFLSRVAQSQFREQLVLKGGVLLAAWNARRPTRDIDFAALGTSNETKYVLDACCTIASISQADGITFDVASAAAIIIRDDDEYSGVRVSMMARIATAQITFHIDVNVGVQSNPVQSR
ncbi:MAG TPA: nucleotidyl transferase AbiEii/AbiGii toxin family protein [Candidatus Paceibacterota bacterium]|nr:nucleotidyl transferase AbiEii/AbiGii toxin family protein [Candidatus Paceibacterota bacterium]